MAYPEDFGMSQEEINQRAIDAQRATDEKKRNDAFNRNELDAWVGSLQKQGRLGADGKFLGPQAGNDYGVEGIYPEDMYRQWVSDRVTPMEGVSASNKTLEQMAQWRPGTQNRGNGFLGNAMQGIEENPLMNAGANYMSGGWFGYANAGRHALDGDAKGAATNALAGYMSGDFPGGESVGPAAGAGVSDATSSSLIQEANAAQAGSGLTGSAPGLAGRFGMDAGYGATALNNVALNTGTSLARGKSLGDSVKSGAVSGLMSPIGSMAGNYVGGALGDTFSQPITRGLSTIASNTATGAASGAVSGLGLGEGAKNGMVNGLLNAGGNYVGGLTTDSTGNRLVGDLASQATKDILQRSFMKPPTPKKTSNLGLGNR